MNFNSQLYPDRPMSSTEAFQHMIQAAAVLNRPQQQVPLDARSINFAAQQNLNNVAALQQQNPGGGGGGGGGGSHQAPPHHILSPAEMIAALTAANRPEAMSVAGGSSGGGGVGGEHRGRPSKLARVGEDFSFPPVVSMAQGGPKPSQQHAPPPPPIVTSRNNFALPGGAAVPTNPNYMQLFQEQMMYSRQVAAMANSNNNNNNNGRGGPSSNIINSSSSSSSRKLPPAGNTSGHRDISGNNSDNANSSTKSDGNGSGSNRYDSFRPFPENSASSSSNNNNNLNIRALNDYAKSAAAAAAAAGSNLILDTFHDNRSETINVSSSAAPSSSNSLFLSGGIPSSSAISNQQQRMLSQSSSPAIRSISPASSRHSHASSPLDSFKSQPKPGGSSVTPSVPSLLIQPNAPAIGSLHQPSTSGQSSSSSSSGGAGGSHRQPPLNMGGAKLALDMFDKTIKRPRLIVADQHKQLNQELSINTKDDKEQDYNPHFEQISPTPNEEPDEQTRPMDDKLLGEVGHKEGQVAIIQAKLEHLYHRQVELEKATTVQQEPSEEPSIEMREPSFSQIIYNENLKRVAQNARMHTPLKAVVTDEPLYNQPSDCAVVYECMEQFSRFRGKLIERLKQQQQNRLTRQAALAERYDQQMSAWLAKQATLETPAKRKEEAKLRDYFERQFPELKKQREDNSRLTRANGGARGTTIRAEVEIEEIVDPVQLQELQAQKYRQYSVIPPMMYEELGEVRPIYHNNNNKIDDPVELYKSTKTTNIWTEAEKTIYKEKFLQHPKNFVAIASFLERKSPADCVLYYYMSKKAECYKQQLKRANKKRNTRSAQMKQQQAQAQRDMGLQALLSGKRQPYTASILPYSNAGENQLSAKTYQIKKGPDSASLKMMITCTPPANTPNGQVQSVLLDLVRNPNSAGYSASMVMFNPGANGGPNGEGNGLNGMRSINLLPSLIGAVSNGGEPNRQQLAGLEETLASMKESDFIDCDNLTCTICSEAIESRDATKSFHINGDNFLLFGLSLNDLKLGMRACAKCHARNVKRQCMIPSCKTPKRKVKKIKQLPFAWMQMALAEKQELAEELDIPIETIAGCARCVMKVQRRLGAREIEEEEETTNNNNDNATNAAAEASTSAAGTSNQNNSAGLKDNQQGRNEQQPQGWPSSSSATATNVFVSNNATPTNNVASSSSTTAPPSSTSNANEDQTLGGGVNNAMAPTTTKPTVVTPTVSSITALGNAQHRRQKDDLRRRWTEEEIDRLRTCIKQYGKDWATIASIAFSATPSKSAKELRRFYCLMRHEASLWSAVKFHYATSGRVARDSETEDELTDSDSEEANGSDTASATSSIGGGGKPLDAEGVGVGVASSVAGGGSGGGGAMNDNAKNLITGASLSSSSQLLQESKSLSASQGSIKSDYDSSATMSADEGQGEVIILSGNGSAPTPALMGSTPLMMGGGGGGGGSTSKPIYSTRGQLIYPTGATRPPTSATSTMVPNCLINPNAPSVNDGQGPPPSSMGHSSRAPTSTHSPSMLGGITAGLPRSSGSSVPGIITPGSSNLAHLSAGLLQQVSGIGKTSKEEPYSVRELINRAIESSLVSPRSGEPATSAADALHGSKLAQQQKMIIDDFQQGAQDLSSKSKKSSADNSSNSSRPLSRSSPMHQQHLQQQQQQMLPRTPSRSGASSSRSSTPATTPNKGLMPQPPMQLGGAGGSYPNFNQSLLGNSPSPALSAAARFMNMQGGHLDHQAFYNQLSRGAAAAAVAAGIPPQISGLPPGMPQQQPQQRPPMSKTPNSNAFSMHLQKSSTPPSKQQQQQQGGGMSSIIGSITQGTPHNVSMAGAMANFNQKFSSSLAGSGGPGAPGGGPGYKGENMMRSMGSITHGTPLPGGLAPPMPPTSAVGINYKSMPTDILDFTGGGKRSTGPTPPPGSAAAAERQRQFLDATMRDNPYKFAEHFALEFADRSNPGASLAQHHATSSAGPTYHRPFSPNFVPAQSPGLAFGKASPAGSSQQQQQQQQSQLPNMPHGPSGKDFAASQMLIDFNTSKQMMQQRRSSSSSQKEHQDAIALATAAAARNSANATINPAHLASIYANEARGGLPMMPPHDPSMALLAAQQAGVPASWLLSQNFMQGRGNMLSGQFPGQQPPPPPPSSTQAKVASVIQSAKSSQAQQNNREQQNVNYHPASASPAALAAMAIFPSGEAFHSMVNAAINQQSLGPSAGSGLRSGGANAKDLPKSLHSEGFEKAILEIAAQQQQQQQQPPPKTAAARVTVFPPTMTEDQLDLSKKTSTPAGLKLDDPTRQLYRNIEESLASGAIDFDRQRHLARGGGAPGVPPHLLTGDRSASSSARSAAEPGGFKLGRDMLFSSEMFEKELASGAKLAASYAALREEEKQSVIKGKSADGGNSSSSNNMEEASKLFSQSFQKDNSSSATVGPSGHMTAASLIDAIITKQINIDGGRRGAVLVDRTAPVITLAALSNNAEANNASIRQQQQQQQHQQQPQVPKISTFTFDKFKTGLEKGSSLTPSAGANTSSNGKMDDTTDGVESKSSGSNSAHDFSIGKLTALGQQASIGVIDDSRNTLRDRIYNVISDNFHDSPSAPKGADGLITPEKLRRALEKEQQQQQQQQQQRQQVIQLAGGISVISSAPPSSATTTAPTSSSSKIPDIEPISPPPLSEIGGKPSPAFNFGFLSSNATTGGSSNTITPTTSTVNIGGDAMNNYMQNKILDMMNKATDKKENVVNANHQAVAPLPSSTTTAEACNNNNNSRPQQHEAQPPSAPLNMAATPYLYISPDSPASPGEMVIDENRPSSASPEPMAGVIAGGESSSPATNNLSIQPPNLDVHEPTTTSAAAAAGTSVIKMHNNSTSLAGPLVTSSAPGIITNATISTTTTAGGGGGGSSSDKEPPKPQTNTSPYDDLSDVEEDI